MKKGEAYFLNNILSKVKITGAGVSKETRSAVMKSKIALSNVSKKFDEDRNIIITEFNEKESSEYLHLIEELAMQESDTELTKITEEQFDTLFSDIELTTAEVELLYNSMLAAEA